MGQTLTHGVYLPDEGERNCYNGLAANWSILDGAVGTVAEHTTALSGKAPLAHTHTKSDVTDLFNSANMWSGDNTFSKTVGFTKVNATTLYAQNSRVELGDSGLSGDSYNQIAFWDKNGDNVSYLRQTYGADGTNSLNIFVRNKFLNGVPDTTGTVDYSYFGLRLNPDKSKEAVFKASLKPYDSTIAYNLGDATYQWNSLYAKNYYYNGVAWGLDKVNTWSNVNKFTSIIQLQYLQSSAYSDIRFSNENNVNECVIRNYTGNITIGKKYQSESAWFNGSQITLTDNGTVQIKSYDGTETWTVNFTPVGVYPTSNNALELGTSTNKWKTLNGINPGALSLPDVSDGDPISTVGWSLTGARNTYTPTENGWFFIRVKGSASARCSLNIHSGSYNDNYPTWVSFNDPAISLSTSLVVPTQKTVNLYVYIIAAEIEQLIFFPCLGNV